MAKRKSTGKRLRFEIFKRDGFRCIYCGKTPVQAELRVDHVVPIAEGGTNDAANLATSCHDCNAGKAARTLEDKQLAPSIATDAHRDHAEQIREFLEIQKQTEAAKKEASITVLREWERVVGPMTQGMFDRLPDLMARWDFGRLYEAMGITGRKLGTPGKPFDANTAVSQAKYFHGILRRWRGEEAA